MTFGWAPKDSCRPALPRALNGLYDQPGFFIEYPVVEYSGIQRTGKTTMMMADVINKCLNPDFGYGFEKQDCHFNFWVDINGVNCHDNEEFLWVLKQVREKGWRRKVLCMDEASQPPLMYARGYGDKEQTKNATHVWQMPKKENLWLWTSNIGNSGDVQLRDGTWLCIMPVYYHHGLNRADDYIDYRVIHAYEQWDYYETLYYPAPIQDFFDTRRPIK